MGSRTPGPNNMRRNGYFSCLIVGLIALTLSPVIATADFNIGAGTSFDLGNAQLDNGESPLTVEGEFSAAIGNIATGDFTIAAGGTVNGESGTFEICGDWDNQGTFNADTSTVSFVDGCTNVAEIVGDTQFANLSIASATAKQFHFQAGSTQTVTSVLSFLGNSTARVVLRSTVTGNVAFIDAQGGATGNYVDVEDINAIGTPIALENSITGTGALGWLSASETKQIVMAGPLAMGLMALLLTGLGIQRGARRAA